MKKIDQLDLSELKKENEAVRDWTAYEMEMGIRRGYLLYYWALYKQHEEAA